MKKLIAKLSAAFDRWALSLFDIIPAQAAKPREIIYTNADGEIVHEYTTKGEIIE